MTDDEIPERVRRAEARRKFRQMLEDSSLGCPQPIGHRCGRALGAHMVDEWGHDGRPINPRCPS